MKKKYAEHPSRRQIAEWLSQQEIHQLYHPSKGQTKNIKSNMKTPKTPNQIQQAYENDNKELLDKVYDT
jgi:hypothetical protein